MSYTFSSMIRILLIQCFLTALLAIPFKNAAAFEVNHDSIVSARVNSYVFDGDKIDLKEELMLQEGEKVKILNIRAQGIEENAQIALEIDDDELIVMPLEDKMKTLQFRVNKKVKSLSVLSNAAFVRAAKARVSPEGDEPHPEDIGRGFWSVQLIK